MFLYCVLCKLLMRTRLLVCMLCMLLLFPLVSARTIWVDNSCAENGNGNTEVCGSNGPFNDLHDALRAVSTGDTVMIKEGAGPYITNNLGDLDESTGIYWDPGFFMQTHPWPTEWTTIRSAPGHRAVIASCSTSVTEWCEIPALNLRWDYIHVHNLTVIGGLNVLGVTLIENNTFFRGQGTDGNFALVKIGGRRDENDVLITRGSIVRHNHFMDVPTLPYHQATQAFMYSIKQLDLIIEYNTMERYHSPGGWGGYIDKRHSYGTVFRYNVLRDTMGGAFGNEVDVIGNLIVCRESGSTGGFQLGPGPGVMAHNTVVGCEAGWVASSGGQQGTIYNNIFHQMQHANMRTGYATNPFSPSMFIDHNIYTPERYYAWIEQWYVEVDSFAEWRSVYGFDAHSVEAECDFIDTDWYRLVPGSMCSSFGRVGGVPSGAAVAAGYEGVTDCVGHLCGRFAEEPVVGVCGSRASSFAADVVSWPSGSSYCSSGAVSSQPSFPAVGESVSWTCGGVLCSASRAERRADVDGDGVVDVSDLLVVVANLGRSPSHPDFVFRADVNEDGVVDVLDLVLVAREIGS